jgi:RNA polymerase sigma-70 factor (ECF subfamily)
MEPTDNNLMLAVKSGDAEPFALLFDRYQRRLFEFFYRFSGDSASSEDLVQEVFLRMLKYRNSFRADSDFRPWMYQIARSVRIDRFNAQREERSLPESAADTLQSRSSGPFQYLMNAERLSALQKALLELPEEKRELLILARFQELKYEEIGSLLEVGTGTIKVRVHRAMLELREILQRIAGPSTEAKPCVAKKFGK